MRIYLAADAAVLAEIAAGRTTGGVAFIAESEDEEAEFAALEEAAEHGPVVAVFEVDREQGPFEFEKLDALHVDADGSGDLAWYAAQEIEAVLRIVQNTAS